MRPGLSRVGSLLLTIAVCGCSVGAQTPPVRELWRLDFENVAGPEALEGISWGAHQARLVERVGGEGRCLEVANTKPGYICGIDIELPVTIERNLILAFDHRQEIDEGKEGAYLGMSFFSGGKQAFWQSDRFSSEWRHVEVQLSLLSGRFGVDMRPGLILERIQLYARSKDIRERGDNPANLKVWFDNIRLYVGQPMQSLKGGGSYTCHNNPPLLDWRSDATATHLQYGPDEAFPAEVSVTVPLTSPRPFYVPPAPLEAGTWYYRLRTVTELYDGWGPVHTVIIPERTHSYVLPGVDFARLAQAPRPRLRQRLPLASGGLAADEAARRLRQVERAVSVGVPEHPGPWKEGDPRWPQWIDWYGGVAGNITARTGSRLKQVAETAILTGEPQAIEAAKTLLLAACEWDPEGGSSAKRGDLQAASLLQGMVWCYDVCEARLSAPERELVHDRLKQRVLQFYTSISPFRLNPSQNHPWKKTTAVTESALVLLGVFPEAEEWLDVALHVFGLRILPSMGFQGENQEGISYWSYGVNMLADFADLMLFLGGVDFYDHPWLRQTCRFPLYCAPPESYAISFADNSSQGNAVIRGPAGSALVGLLGSRVGDPYALWYANRQAPGVAARPPADLPQSVFYPYIGYALFNTCLSNGLENVSVGMRSGPYHAGHQHDDNNGFVIHAYGDKLAVDGGYYDWYGSPHFKAYSIKTLAHNTLLVDGQCQKRGTDGEIVAYFDSPGFGLAVGDAGSNPLVYNGTLSRFDRRLIFLKPDVVMVHDLVQSSGEARQLDWLLHAHTDEAFPADSGTRSFRIERPGARLHGTFLAPSDLGLTVAKSFDIAPQKPRASVFLPWDEVQPEWTLTATPAQARVDEEFVALMRICRADDTVPVEPPLPLDCDTAHACEVRLPYGRYIVASRRLDNAGGMIRVAGLESDGSIAAVLLDYEERILNAFAVDASVLRFAGRTLHRSAVPRSWAMDEASRPLPLQAEIHVNGTAKPMEGISHHLPDGPVNTWWTTLDAGERARCRVVVHGWDGTRPPQLRLNGRSETGTDITVLMPKGTPCLSVNGRGRFERISLETLRYQVIDAQELPRTTVLQAGDILIDADAPGPVRESTITGRRMDKVAATGGTAYCSIDGPVQWAEWEFPVTTAADYQVLVRAASEYSVIERELRINGRAFPAAGSAVRMPGSGGWCRDSDDWAWYAVPDARGEPARLRLTPGTHTLRWEFVGGSQNVDAFVLRPLP